MSGARLGIRKAKQERLGFPLDQIRGFFDPAWYKAAYDDTGFENTCPIGVDQGYYNPDQCTAKDNGYGCFSCNPQITTPDRKPND